MRVFILILFIVMEGVAQAQPWPALKYRIQQEQEKNARSLTQARTRWPAQVSDSLNHLLLQAILPSGKPVYLTTLNANAAITTGANKLQSGLTGFVLQGNGHHIFQWDAGAVIQHVEFDDRVLANEGLSTNRHATHIAGTLVASGVNPSAKGMAPQAQLHAYYFDDDLFELATQSESNPYGYLITNHSYGNATGWQRVSGNWQWFGDALVSSEEDFTAGLYSLRTSLIDEIAYYSPYHTIVWAAGNDRADVGNGTRPPDCNGGVGYDCIVQEATAKNVITVGGVDQVLNYTGPTSVSMPGFSSWGPTDDGRIKPDLVSDGASVFSTTNTGIDQYATLGGTSMATATVSGSLMLLQELYGKLNGNTWMRASTLKALAIHTAREAGSAPGPDYSFGWGLLDVAEAARIISRRDDVNTYLVEGKLSNNDRHEWVLSSQANQKITATLVWSDPAGLSPGTVLDPPFKMLINDLDLRLIDSNGIIHYPWTLNPESPTAVSIKTDNTRDNVEKIELNFPEAKTYRLQLTHKGYLLNDEQPYSLIITYTSNNAPRTLYWVGGSGSWHDGTHWSLSSGGTVANSTPTSNDRIIVDENSFPTAGTITLNSSVTCQSLRWYCSKAAGIHFNNRTLTVTKELTLASEAFQKTGSGRFILNSTDTGWLNATHSLAAPNVEFALGNWLVRGTMRTDTVTISAGQVLVANAHLDINRFVGMGTASNVDMHNTVITIRKSWQSDQAKTGIVSQGSTIILDGVNVSMQADNLIWSGVLVNSGQASLSGNLILDSLELSPGSITSIAQGNTLTVQQKLTLGGNHAHAVTLQAGGAATLHTMFRQKICTDYALISNVNLTGDALINVGANSTLQNASGWSKQACEQVLFADFDVAYTCAHALTTFTSTSTGTITNYQWNFGDATSNTNTSTESNPTHQYKGIGDYIVTLTVSRDGLSNTYTKTIRITANTLPLTSIEHNSEVLFSSAESSQYQWFNNEVAIANETGRVFAYGGVQGLYRVVLYDAQCNSPSELFSISGLQASAESLSIYPNPASQKIYFGLSHVTKVQLVDWLGRTVTPAWHAAEGWIDVSTIRPGMYIVTFQQGTNRYSKKVFIAR